MNKWLYVAVLLAFAGCKEKTGETKGSPNKSTSQEGNASMGSASKAVPLALTGVEDKTRFDLYINGKKLATTKCHLKKDGNYSADTTITFAGQTLTKKFTVAADKAGRWNAITFTAKTGITEVTRQGAKIEINNKTKKKKFSLEAKPDHLLYDNNCMVFETFALRRYDTKKGGTQKFMRFLVPAKMEAFAFTAKPDATRELKGTKMVFKRFDMEVAGITVELWVQDFKVVYAKVPLQGAAFVREGYGYLNVEKVTDPLLSKPLHKVEKSTVMVPMRDKVELATDIYRPQGITQKVPLILIRTPYKKELNELDANYFASRGYAVAVQDVRGRFASKGTWVPFMNEAEDGHDAIEWLAAQPWCDGKVGMIGGSYVGWVQLWAATKQPKHLVTIIPNVAPPGPFFNIPYEYGVFFIFGAIWWAEILETNATGDISGAKFSRINDRKYEKELLSLPVIDLDTKILGKKNRYWRAWIKNNTNGAYWDKAKLKEQLKKVSIPVLLQSGWFDGDGIGSKLNYLSLREGGNKNLKLIIGPWGHTAKASRRLGETDFGEAAAPDLQVLYLRWFDHWLKGVKNKIMEEPRVELFTMFSNKWARGNDYPLPGTAFTKLYLSSTKGAQSAKGDGRLAFTPPKGGAPFDAYTYDPGDPTPAPDFYFKDSEQLKKEKEGKAVDLKALRQKRKMNHSVVSAKRKDILVYETTPLTEPLTIAGPLSAVLYASSDAKDTDWFVSLSLVQKDGRVRVLGRGKIRARFREDMATPKLLEKDKVYPFTLDLWHTGITFSAGEKLRVEVTSAAFPIFSRNLNTGGHNEMESRYVKANQKVYHSAKHPSHVVLPVIK